MRKYILLLWLAVSLITLFALEPVSLRTAGDINWHGHWEKTNDNCVIAVWEDTMFGDIDILAQKYSSSGQAMWQEPAQIVVRQGVQQIHQLVVTSDNNFVVTYGDGSNPETWQLFAQKFNTEGQCLWTEHGVQLNTETYDGELTYAVANAVGGVYVVVIDSSPLNRIRGFQLNTFGTNMWDAQGLVLLTHDNSVYLRNAVTDYAGGLIIQIDKYNSSVNMSTHLLRISSSGLVVGQNPMIPASTFPGNVFTIMAGGDGNFILYNLVISDPSYMQFQKMNNQGNLLLPELQNYVFSNNLNLDSDIAKATATDGGLMLLWKETTINSNTQLRLQRFDSSLIPLWLQSGLIITNEDSRQFLPSMSITDDNSVWATWLSVTGTDYFNIALKAQLVSPIGIVSWLESPVISGIEGYKSMPVCKAFSDRAVFIWKEISGNHRSIRRQALSSNGTTYLDEFGVPFSTHLNGNGMLSDVFALDNGYIGIWMDDRAPNHNNAFFQIVNNQQACVLEENGKALCADFPGYLGIQSTHRLPNNKVAVLFYIDDFYSRMYYLQLISSNGEAMYPGNGLMLGENMWLAKLSSVGEDIYIAWIAVSQQGSGISTTLKGQRITDGNIMWDAEGKTIVGGAENDYCDYPDLQGRYFLWAQQDFNTGAWESKTILLNEDGNPAPGWNSSGLTLIAPNPMYFQQIRFAGISDECLTAIIQGYDFDNITILMQKVSSAGVLLWGENGIPFCNNSNDVVIRDVNFNNGLSSLYGTQGSQEQLLMQKYDSNGNRLFGDDGLLITTPSSNWYTAKLVKYQNNRYSVLWTDMIANNWTQVDIYHKQISSDGVAGVVQVLCDAPLQQHNIKVAVNGNSAFVAWDDTRAGILNEDKDINSIYGTIIHSSETALSDEVVVPRAGIVSFGNYPNPFNPSTTLSFALADKGLLNLDIFNIKGQKIRSLLRNTVFENGRHSVRWDGKDDKGNALSSGVYMYKLQSGTEAVSGKMLMMK